MLNPTLWLLVAEFVTTISSETCVTARDATMATCITACSVNSLLHKATGVVDV